MSKYVIRSEERPKYAPLGHQGAVGSILIGVENVGARNMEVVLGLHEADAVTEPHSHLVEQAYYILEGRAYLEVDGQREEMKAGDVAFFPPGTVHCVNAISSYKALVIYAPPRR